MPASHAACWRVSWPASPLGTGGERKKVAAEGSVEAGEEALLACDAWMRHAVEALSDATCVVTIATGRGDSILPREAGSFNFTKCRVA